MRDHLTKTVLRLSGLILLALLLLNGFRQTFAQTADTLWRPPRNISQSGTASAPFMVLDATGTAHLFWQDSLDGFLYTPYRDGEPGIPQPVTLPFSTPPFTTPAAPSFERLFTPRLAAAEERLYTVWTNDQQTLFFSRSALANLDNPEAWSSPLTLDTAAVGPQIAVDRAGNLHVAYVKQRGTAEQPAGIYYRRFNEATAQWNSPLSVYTSNYLRAITTEQANVRLTVSGENQVYLVWDNPLLGMIFFARSTDGGNSWTEPLVIDQKQPGDAPEALGAARVELLARGPEVHLTWQAQHGPSGCQQYHQWSVNRGQTWREATVIFSDTSQCPTKFEFVSGDDGLTLLLLAQVGARTYMIAWDSEQWSDPMSQTMLATFTDQQTLRRVTLGCLNPVIGRDNLMTVAGCSSDAGNNDVWILQRPLDDIDSWFESQDPAAWSSPISLARSETGFSATRLLVDRDGQFHAVWVGPTTDASLTADRSIYYAYWNEVNWSRTALIFSGDFDQLAAIVDPENRLMIIWRDLEVGALFFSQVRLDRAMFPMDWSIPVQLPAPSPIVSHPDMIIDQDGTLHVSYTISLNEGRGVYITQSIDAGQTWSDPAAVFQADAAEWDMAGQAWLGSDGNGGLHVVWNRYTQPAQQPISFYYARSQDNGQSWSEAELLFEGHVKWGQVVTSADNQLFRFWQNSDGGRTQLWSQQSLDGGEQWERPILIVVVDTEVSGVDILTPPGGQLYVLTITENNNDGATLSEWSRTGEQWFTGDSINVNVHGVGRALMAAAVNENGLVGALSGGRLVNNGEQTSEYSLQFTSRLLDLPETAAILPASPPTEVAPGALTEPLITPSATQTALIAPVSDGAVEITPEATRDFSGDPFVASSSTSWLVAGIAPAAVIVLLIFLIALYSRGLWKKRT